MTFSLGVTTMLVVIGGLIILTQGNRQLDKMAGSSCNLSGFFICGKGRRTVRSPQSEITCLNPGRVWRTRSGLLSHEQESSGLPVSHRTGDAMFLPAADHHVPCMSCVAEEEERLQGSLTWGTVPFSFRDGSFGLCQSSFTSPLVVSTDTFAPPSLPSGAFLFPETVEIS